jgi:import inner membrane translocase subunit TIM10
MADAAARAEIRTQVHALNDLTQRIADECYRKCVPNPRDGDLSIAEMTCIDRCVPKYLAAHDLVSKELNTIRNAVAGSVPAATK